MKAIEAMEKAEQRKKDTTGTESGQTPTGTGNAGGKRRRSSSSYRNSVNAFDSNVEASSADESKPEPKRNRKRGRSKLNLFFRLRLSAGSPQLPGGLFSLCDVWKKTSKPILLDFPFGMGTYDHHTKYRGASVAAGEFFFLEGLI